MSSAWRGRSRTVRLNRPKQLNVLDVAMGEGLVAAMTDLSANKKVRAVVLSGAGRSFMAGGDLTLFHQVPDECAGGRDPA